MGSFSEFRIFGGFIWVCSSGLVDEPGFEVRVFPDPCLGSVQPVSGRTGSKFGLFVRGSMFGFGG